eukprot:scaffold10163_cov270-Chaetoceros_neogracile.AAC.15
MVSNVSDVGKGRGALKGAERAKRENCHRSQQARKLDFDIPAKCTIPNRMFVLQLIIVSGGVT